MDDSLKGVMERLPESPGVYRFFNAKQELIYVGKAKDIKKRVKSYFNKQSGVSKKTLKLISEIQGIEYTVSGSEYDALLLENNFIKEYQPRYNILLKDDKTYPYLCIVKEPFPRLIISRKYKPGEGEFFGPYSSGMAMKSILELTRKLYCIRTCNLNLSESNVHSKKFKVCLEFQIGNCKGPCEGLQTEAAYLEDVNHVRHILKGELSAVYHYLENEMQGASERMEFEKAHLFKEKITVLDKYQAKSIVVNTSMTNIDVFTITSTEDYAYVNYMEIKEGAIMYSFSREIKKKLNEPDDGLLSQISQAIREEHGSKNRLIVSNVPLTVDEENTENIVPKIGDKKKLVELSLKNAFELRREREMARGKKKGDQTETLDILKKDLHLTQAPNTIECFDNSNFHGSFPVASMVRFTKGKPDKKEYRHFSIKTVEGINDFASMKEVVGRRYKRIVEEGFPLPDLILIDGGKGQLGSALEALTELGLDQKVGVVGIAKKLEEIYRPGDPLPLMIHKKSPGLFLLQQIRDEAHRFAIGFHRKKRGKKFTTSALEEIEGIGKKTADVLLTHFKSMKKIQGAPLDELEKLIGKEKALIIKGLKQKRRP